METMVIDTETAEVELFSIKEQAEKFIRDNNLSKDVCIIMPCIEVSNKEDVELVIYENSDNNNIFGNVADYQENVFNSDFIDTPNEPIKYMYAYDFEMFS